MVTKVYCDHCGNPAPNAQKYIFGASNHFFGMNDGACAQAPPAQQSTAGYSPALQSSGIKGIPAFVPAEIVRSGTVDLCVTCQIVWMNRVKALTQVSEP